VDRRERLRTLTDRWRARRDARSVTVRQLADPGRGERARHAFPFRDVTPRDYVAAHGESMVGFTYDEARYADEELDAWLVEVGRLLRARR
jgi:hypothetical protein